MDRDFYHALSRLAPMLAVVVVMSIVNACKKPQPAALPKPASEAQVEAGAILPPVAKKRVLEVPVWTQTIAVVDTQVQRNVPERVTEDYVPTITERVEAAFLATGRFEVVERARLESVRKELKMTTDALWFDQTSVSKLGRFLGARYLILPSARIEVGAMSTRLDLQVKVLDTETASTVQSFTARTTSSSLSTNSSITACLDRIKAELQTELAPIYPAQAMVVHSPKDGIFWAEAKQVRRCFQPGQRVRLLEPKEVMNPVKGTVAPFYVEAGRGRVLSVEAYGVVVKATGVKAEEGWLVEVLP